jgi:hypothetical protein
VVLKVLITRWFARFARKELLSATQICGAVARAESGQIDADLGGGLIKQRISRAGAGRSGGFRTLIAYRAHDRAVFLYGFAKSERDNIGEDDLADLKATAKIILAYDAGKLKTAISAGDLKEMDCNG